MTEALRILDQLHRAFDGDAWSGPSLQDTLAGLSAAQAAARPLAHSIGEIVRHLTTWADTVAARLEQQIDMAPVAPDWPPFAATATEAEWKQVLANLHWAHARVLAAAAALPLSRLDVPLGEVRDRADGSGVSPYVLLHGTAQHYLYHAGQIALLRKFV